MPQATITQLVDAIAAGAVVSFPTDTVPALAVAPDCATQLFELKGRSLDKPLILLGATAAQFQPYLQGSEQDYARWNATGAAFWPGALTLVLPASSHVPLAMHPHTPDTIGVRVPDHPLALELLQQTGPLATSSANRSGDPPLLTMAAIAQAFPTVFVACDPRLEPQAIAGSQRPSTVAQWHSPGWQILRQGSVILPSTA